MCVFALKQIVSMSTPVYICYLNVSKALDRVNHWSLYRKPWNKSVPKLIVRLIFSGTQRNFYCTVGCSLSNYFTAVNDVRQCGIMVFVMSSLMTLVCNCLVSKLSTIVTMFLWIIWCMLMTQYWCLNLQHHYIKLINYCAQFTSANELLLHFMKLCV
jgi:hypothetical protein